MAEFTNSPLANQDKSLRSTNYTKGRTLNGKSYKIDTIVLHIVVGHLTMKSLAGCFQGSRRASSNYGITDNLKPNDASVGGGPVQVGLFVEEKDRSWCTSSSACDVRAITVEMDSDLKTPYNVTDGVLNKAIELCIDICKRNGLKKMWYYEDKETAMIKQETLREGEGIFLRHDMFANKSCPGPYVKSKMPWIVEQVNKAIAEPEPTPAPTPAPQPVYKSLDELAKEVIDGKWGNGSDRVKRITAAYTSGEIKFNYTQIQNRVNEMLAPKKYWRVQTGAYRIKANCDAQVAKLKAKGYDTYVVQRDGLYKVQLGAYSKRENADKMAVKLMLDGFDTYIVYY